MDIQIINYLKKAEFPKLIQDVSVEDAYQAFIDEYNTRVSLLDLKIKKIDSKEDNDQNNILVRSLLKTLAQREYLLINEINHLLDKLIISPFVDQQDLHHAYLDEIIDLFGMKRSTIHLDKEKIQQDSNEQLIKKLSSRLEILSSAGTKGAYKHHLLSLDPRILDVSIQKKDDHPGELDVYLLMKDKSLLDKENENIFINEIKSKASKKDISCIRDTMNIHLAQLIKVNINISLHHQDDNEKISNVKQQITETIQKYMTDKYKLNTSIHEVELSSLIADDCFAYIKEIKFSLPDHNDKNEVKSSRFNLNEVPLLGDLHFN